MAFCVIVSAQSPGGLTVSTLGLPSGASNPASCAVGQLFFNTGATVGQNLQGCTATNSWTQQAGGGGAASSIASGPTSGLPSSCSTGAVYFATDQPAAQQLYTCSATNTWTQILGFGGSGALAVTSGALDIVTSVVPRKAQAETLTGLWTLQPGVDFTEQSSCATPSSGKLCLYANNDGTLHFVNPSGTDSAIGGGGGSVTQLVDTNGNPTVKSVATASAVNWITAQNAATGNGPVLSVGGTDTDIAISIVPKGLGAAVLGSSNSFESEPHSSTYAGPTSITSANPTARARPEGFDRS